VTQKAEVSAFILSKLPNDVVSDILMDLPEEQSLAFVNKISEGISFAPFVEKAIEKIIRDDFLENRMLKAGAIDSQIVTEYFYSNISQRLAGSIRESVDGMDPLNEKEAAKAIADLMSFVGKLIQEERITLIKKAETSMFPTIDIDDI